MQPLEITGGAEPDLKSDGQEMGLLREGAHHAFNTAADASDNLGTLKLMKNIGPEDRVFPFSGFLMENTVEKTVLILR